MAAPALDAAPVELEPRPPGGGGLPPGDFGDGDGRGDGDSGDRDRKLLYRLGTLLTLASVAALFASLIVAFWFRSRNAFLWQPVKIPNALWLSTLVLGLSSWMLEIARASLRARLGMVYRRRVLLTVYLGLAFIACQGAALLDLMQGGALLRGHPSASMFYVFTGAHGAHLAFGILALNYLLFARKKRWAEQSALAESVALYWHFMGAVWLVLFGLLMLWAA